MHIANPIYDVVFKYMMSDAKIAKIFISAIIDQEIEEINFKPQEHTGELMRTSKEKPEDNETFFTVYRIDFAARIKTPEGSKQVIIELQKAKFPTDIMRFRRYLGGQYSDSNNTEYINKNKVGIPIINIYFLGHKLEKIHGVPLIKVSRQYVVFWKAHDSFQLFDGKLSILCVMKHTRH